MLQGLRGNADSTKASNVLLVFAALCVLLYVGKIEVELLEKFLEIVMPTWLVAHAGEKGAKAIAASKARSDGSDGDDRDHGVASPM